MATVASGQRSAEQRERQFFLAMAAGLAAFTVFAFAQWAARGMVAPLSLPWWVHVHGAAMICWLVLLVAQSYFVAVGRNRLHRQFGRMGAPLLLAIAVFGIVTGYQSVALHRVPPFWTNGFLLALAFTSTTLFVALAAAGIALRSRTDWHRRLMIGATIILLTAAFDRTLPAQLVGAARPFSEGGLQLVAVAVMAAHDWRARGRPHAATVCVIVAILAEHGVIAALAAFPPFIVLAERIAA